MSLLTLKGQIHRPGPCRCRQRPQLITTVPILANWDPRLSLYLWIFDICFGATGGVARLRQGQTRRKSPLRCQEVHVLQQSALSEH